MTYSDKHGTFFGRLTDDGDVAVLHVEDGSAATRLDTGAWPVGSNVSARHEHPEGIILYVEDADSIGIKIEA